MRKAGLFGFARKRKFRLSPSHTYSYIFLNIGLSKLPMRHLLIFLLAYSIFLTSSVLGDLPSCIRAKCSHCKVPFIAQMCPIACSGCPNLTQKFLTTEQQARSSSAEEIHQRAYAHQPHNIKVPFAQQIPNLDSNRNRGNFERNNFQNQKVLQQQNQFQPTRQQHQPQQYINNPPQQQFNEGWQGNGGGGQFGQQFTQQIPNQAYGGNYQFPQQQIQYPPGTFQPQIQQTTNFGGSYGQAGAIGQNQPGPNNLQGPAFNNPFQPFLQQSFQSVQQIQPSQTGFSPPNLSPINQPSFQAPLNQQTPGEIAQIPPQNVVQQSQFFSNQGPNQNNIQFPLQNQNIQPAQQVFIQKPINEAQPFQQNGFRPVGINQPILHAVPNVVDPLQRPRQLLQNIRESQEKYSGEKIIYNKGAATNEIKKPIGITTNFPVDRGQKCPKSNWEPCVSKEIANQRFQNCCSRLGDGCLQLCSYDQNLTTIQLAVLTGRCPVNKVADMMLCASGYEDATICCQAFGVFEPGYEQCRPYCNPAGGLPNDGMLAEKYRCLQKLPQIQRCFYLTQRP